MIEMSAERLEAALLAIQVTERNYRAVEEWQDRRDDRIAEECERRGLCCLCAGDHNPNFCTDGLLHPDVLEVLLGLDPLPGPELSW